MTIQGISIHGPSPSSSRPVRPASVPRAPQAPAASEFAASKVAGDSAPAGAAIQAAIEGSWVARGFDPLSPDARFHQRPWGDATVTTMTDGASLRIREVRYPDGSGRIDIDRTLGERVVPGLFETRIRRFDTESFATDPDGTTRQIGLQLGATDRETLLFDSSRLGLRFGIRERSELGVGMEVDGGVRVGGALRGRAGGFLEWRDKKLDVFTSGSLGATAALQSTSYGENDGASELSHPTIPISGAAREFADERGAEIGFGIGNWVTAGVGYEVDMDVGDATFRPVPDGFFEVDRDGLHPLDLDEHVASPLEELANDVERRYGPLDFGGTLDDVADHVEDLYGPLDSGATLEDVERDLGLR